MFIPKTWLWIACTYLVCCQTHPASIEEIYKKEDNDFLDYEAEDTAKEALLFNERYEMAANTTDIEEPPTPDMSTIKNLCKNTTGEDAFVFVCEKEHMISFACIDTVQGKPLLCYYAGRGQFPRAMCVNITTRFVVLCDMPTAYICNQTGDPSTESKMEICYEENRVLCMLENHDYMEPCDNITTINLTLQENLPALDVKWNENWKTERVTIPSGEREEPQKRNQLCLIEEDNLVGCEHDPSNSEACFSVECGVIKVCTDFSAEELPVPICTERNTNRVTTCGKYSNAFLCFPMNNKMKPLMICKFRYRQACLNNDGLLEKCLKKSVKLHILGNTLPEEPVMGTKQDIYYAEYKSSPEWKNFWHEFVYDRNYTRMTANKTTNYLCKPLNATYDLIDCKNETSNTTACISATDRSTGDCRNFKSSEMAVPLCMESSTTRVHVCGSFTHAYMCSQMKNKTSLLRPCSDINRHICVSEKGMFIECSNLPKADNETSVVFFDDSPSISWIWEGNHLCFLQDSKSRYQRCYSHSPLPIACLDTKEWVIKTCEEIERNAEIGIPVCAEYETDRLATCGETSQVNLCHPSEDNSILKPCKFKSRTVCIDRDGQLKMCKDVTKTDKEVDFKTDIDYGNIVIDEPNFKSSRHVDNEKLCMSSDKIVQCENEMERDLACLNVPDGNLASCLSSNFKQLNVPVCRNIRSKELITCEGFNKVNLCHSTITEGAFVPCKVESEFVCFDAGKIQSCSLHRKLQRSMKVIDRSKVPKRYRFETTDYRNSEKVYRVENRSIERIMKDMTYVCKDKTVDMITTCDDEQTINFACLGAKARKVDSCDRLPKTDLIILLCMQKKTRKVFACGKFFRGHLCYSRGTAIETCGAENQHICLTKKNRLVLCKKMREGEEDQKSQKDGKQGDPKSQKDSKKGDPKSQKDDKKGDPKSLKIGKQDEEGGGAEFEDYNDRQAEYGEDKGESEYGEDKEESEYGEDKGEESEYEEDRKGEAEYEEDREGEAEYGDDKGEEAEYGEDKGEENEYGEDKGEEPEYGDYKGEEAEYGEDKGEEPEYGDYKGEEPEYGDYRGEEPENGDYKGEAAEYGDDNGEKSEYEEDREGEAEYGENKEESEHDFDKGDTEYDLNKDIEYDGKEEKADSKRIVLTPVGFKYQDVASRRGNIFDGIVYEYDGSEPLYHVSIAGKRAARAITIANTRSSEDDYDPDAEDDEYMAKHLSDIKKKEYKMIAHIHMTNTHLCKASKTGEKLKNCDEVSAMKFACIGARTGLIKACGTAEEFDIALPVCLKVSTNYLVTCDIISNVNLCLEGPSRMMPCEDKTRYACVGQDGTLNKCQQQNPSNKRESLDEKFVRFHCSDCTIDNKMIIIGTPDDVLPETEVFTFPNF